jgi:hypothetical protein
MITQNLPTLKIHQLTDEQYKRVKESEDYDPNALYLTPDEVIDLSNYELITISDIDAICGASIEVANLSEVKF